MRYTKMHGAGNDFVIIDNRDGAVPEDNKSTFAAHVCTRRLSVGADGVMFVECSREGGDFRMHFFNADGSEGEMCGNGARCIARYGYEHGLAGETQRVETTAGLVIGQRVSTREYRVRLNNPSVFQPRRSVIADGVVYDCGYVELGNPGLPHAVVPVESLSAFTEEALRATGRALRSCANFPKGANVTFCETLQFNCFRAVTFERGVEDFTLACGTGCGSMAAVMTLRGAADGKNVEIRMPGGVLHVDLTVDGEFVKDIYLTGPTDIVSEGELLDEDLPDRAKR